MSKFLSIFLLIISCTLHAEGSWTPIHTLGSSKDLPSPAIDKEGNALVLWKNEGIHFCRFDRSTQTWSDPIKLFESDCEGNSFVRMDSQGNALGVWPKEGQLHSANYDAISNEWSSPIAIPEFKRHKALDFHFFSDDNGILLCQNTDTNSIRASLFDHSTHTWTKPFDLYQPPKNIELSYIKCSFNDKGTGYITWVEKDETQKSGSTIYAMQYLRENHELSSPFQIMKFTESRLISKVFSGFDAHTMSNGNLLALCGILSNLPSTALIYSELLEIDSNNLQPIDNEFVFVPGSYPRAKLNHSDTMIIGAINFDPEFDFAGTFSLFEPGQKEIDLEQTLVMESFVIFFDVGIDRMGNALVSWNEAYKDARVQFASYFNAKTQTWCQEKTLSEDYSLMSAGASRVDMHSNGHGIVVWDSYDELSHQGIIQATIYYPE